MIDRNGFFGAPFALLDDEVAFKGLGLAAGVMFHPEVLKQYNEGQGLHQITGPQVDERRPHGAALGYGNTGAERGVRQRQLALVRYLADRKVPGLCLQQSLQGPDFQGNVAVEKSANTDNDYRAVREQVTETITRAFQSCECGCFVLPFFPGLESQSLEAGRQLSNRFVVCEYGMVPAVVCQVEQLLFLHVLPVLLQAGENSGRVTVEANTG